MDVGTVVVESNGTEVTIIGRGELDLSNTNDFGRALRDASKTAEQLTLDVHATTFIDTAVLEHIARAATNMLQRDKRMKVIAAEGSHPLYVLKAVGFADFLDIVVIDSGVDGR